MKTKIHIVLSFGIAALLLLCPSLTNAQKRKVKSKAKTSVSQKKARSVKVTPPTEKPVAPAAANIPPKTVPDGEPTEDEMKRAVITAMQKRGGTKRDENTVSVDNALTGSSIKIEEFEKLGCKPTNYSAGYFCTYGITLDLNLYSNEGTAAGDRHANALNSLMKMFNGGKTSSYETVTSRFIKSREGWIMTKD